MVEYEQDRRERSLGCSSVLPSTTMRNAAKGDYDNSHQWRTPLAVGRRRLLLRNEDPHQPTLLDILRALNKQLRLAPPFRHGPFVWVQMATICLIPEKLHRRTMPAYEAERKLQYREDGTATIRGRPYAGLFRG
mmetsp:Transcript_36373/g.76608  ORF Transcript_36373/g.76608 Transcript_36373/m.76608 type:complete len:134 (-) Transcript_36373:93-494(-)